MPSLGILPDPGIEFASLSSLALPSGFFTTAPPSPWGLRFPHMNFEGTQAFTSWYYLKDCYRFSMRKL